MKELNKVVFHILFWMTIPLLIFYFKWAAQETTSLPGLPGPALEGFIEIVQNNYDVLIVSLLGSIPIFYTSLFFLTPQLLYKKSYTKIALYVASLIAHFFVVILITNFIFPMYYFFGTPYTMKVLAPIILLSALSGTLFSFKEELQGRIAKEISEKNYEL